MSKFDNQYLNLCEKIKKEGIRTSNRTGDDALRILNYNFEFNLQEEFPILTVKRVGIKWPVLEILWIWQVGSNDVNWLNERGIDIWDEWKIDEDGGYRIPGKEDKFFGKEFAGTIGTAYGYVNTKYGLMKKAIDKIKNNPTDRRIISCLWQECEMATAVLPPCVYEHQWLVEGDTLNIRVEQRSCDVGLGLPFNITQYATLLCLVAQATNLKAGKMFYNMSDTHIYVKHLPGIDTMLSRRNIAYSAPKLWINPEVKDFFEFDNSKELKDIKLIDYKYHPKVDMEISI